MSPTMKWKESAGVLAVVLMLVGLPAALWWWHVALLHQYPRGTRFITLTATADGGIWTQDPIVGYNYWWRKPTRTDTITVNQGDHVVVRVRSADVLHSFAIPVMRIGPLDVPAGHTIEVQFDANRSGVLTFLCWQMCSPAHGSLHGRFVVKETEAQGGS